MNKPLFRIEAERLAAELGSTAEALLERSLRPILHPDFPTRECFLPDELLEFERRGTLTPDRSQHAESCDTCAAMLRSSSWSGAPNAG